MSVTTEENAYDRVHIPMANMSFKMQTASTLPGRMILRVAAANREKTSTVSSTKKYRRPRL